MTSPGSALGRAARRIGALFRRLGRLLLTFLEVIGLRRGVQPEVAAQLLRFKQCYADFRTLLGANHSFLEELADVEQKLIRAERVDLAYIKRKVVRMVADIHRMTASLNAISRDRYAVLPGVLDEIVGRLHGRLVEGSPGLGDGPNAPLAAPLSDLAAAHAPLVGGKMANLGEVRSHVGLLTPDGFAVTADACRLLFRASGIDDLLEKEYLHLASPEGAAELSRNVVDRIAHAAVPDEIRTAVADAYADLCRRAGGPVRVAVRSSAPGEDTELTFAGQFTTRLDVAEPDLLDAYLEVVGSLHAPGAVHYRLAHGVPGEAAVMAVGFVVMVDALVSGVAFSRDPSRSDSRDVLVHATRGYGTALVDGGTPIEALRISARDSSPSAVRREGPAAGSCLSDGEALEIARQALVLEAHFGGPQDVEWSLDRERRLVILQARPLRLAAAAVAAEERAPMQGFEVLLRAGEVACPGVGSGPAVHLDEDGDLDAFPQGAVLVARRSSPRFVRVMTRASAIVTDAGSTTGHMASLARELLVPALLGTRDATRLIPPGAIVTVDASARTVYAGTVPGLESPVAGPRAIPEREARVRSTPVFRLLERVAELLVPLNLSDPRSPEFAAAGCRTLHDIARYVHEKSYEEMFTMGTELGDFRAASYKLDVFLPIDLYVIDLGGGLAPPARGRTIKRAHITSAPLAALLGGMLHRGIPRFGPRPIDAKGLLSIMARHAIESPDQERTFRDPCYAIVSDRYLNYAARVGYHFAAVDTYCGRTSNKNYISFQFKGGAADVLRRGRRTAAIGTILREHGFSTDVRGDLVSARLSKASAAEIQSHLDTIGRLLQFMRQLDVAMVHDGMVEQVARSFMEGKYEL